FFQAEDGIRDGHVIGVQTCALPISLENGRFYGVTFVIFLLAGTKVGPGIDATAGRLCFQRGRNAPLAESHLTTSVPRGWLVASRSEERRVGKEGRGGVAGETRKEKV